MEPSSDRRILAARAFGVVNLMAAAVVALGVFAGLPARWWLVDVPATLVIALDLAAGVGLFAGKSWADKVARIASWVALGLGLALVATIAITASYLSGIYGPVGRGGAVILILVAALALPYLIAVPAMQLVWLGRREKAP